VWININYLALAALHKDPQSADTYIDLRARLIETITAGYVNSGFLFEQYDDKTRQVLFVFFLFPSVFFLVFPSSFSFESTSPLPFSPSPSLSPPLSVWTTLILVFGSLLFCPLRV